ncbi:IS3 family transposase [Micromonospora vinacea]|uniref:IS3 family transposase n=1 Tax=Micromonospora vinacea TaxID=709878 RepID=UPI0018C96AC1|nr:IS3 family transposase [Micromonospora vinacea]
MPKQYPKDLRDRAVRLVREHRGDYGTEWEAIGSIAAKLGIGSAETLRKWVRQAEVDQGTRPGVTSEESVELRRLRRENAELKRANEILKAASGFLRGRARPATHTLVRFIDEHKARFGGVEPICRALTGHGLKIAASTYYKAKAVPPSARSVQDARLLDEIRRVHVANYGVYGARKVWRQLRRDGVEVARCTVERLMRDAGLRGVVRGKKIRTTVADPGHERAGDLVARDFSAAAPNRCWVADFTHVATFAGVVYVAFVVDVYSRAIVGWSAATNKRTPLVLDAVDMGLWRRDRDGRTVTRGLIHHSDAGSQYTSFRFTTHLVAAGIDASIGTVGDALDNALMESTIGLYKTELIKPRGPWRSLAQVELATAEWIDWYNHHRLHSAIGHRPPAEKESMFYAHHLPDQPELATV